MKRINLILLLSILISVYSCKSIEYIPVETVRTEYINTHTTDTIIQNNTTIIKEKGDTIYIFKEREIYKYRDRVDTLIVNDTINTTKYVDRIEYVEVNKLKDWQIILMVLGGVLLGFFGIKLLRMFKI